jgi:serine/threonine-protein kinase
VPKERHGPPTTNAAAQAALRAKNVESALVGTPYRYVGPLGHGGMGEVVLAEHVLLGKLVVVKLLHEHLTRREDMVDRMRIEAQALARLAHPNLVDVTDFGRTKDGRTYLVMQRLAGRTLRVELRERAFLPAVEAISYTRQALAGLAAAHGAGIIHRDVKLDNIFVCDPHPDGPPGRRIKLLDFGIAKILEGRDARAPAPLVFPTETGVAVGTPRFFSPEQARGQKVDERTDIYAMGVVLYTLVAGRGPFHHLSAVLELTRAHVAETPAPPSTYAPQPIPEALDRAILCALAKRPDDRFPNAAAFTEELERIAERLGSTLPPPWARTEVMDTSPRPPLAGSPSPSAARPAAAPEQLALLARATVRVPELAERQEAARRAHEAQRHDAPCTVPLVPALSPLRTPASSAPPPANSPEPMARPAPAPLKTDAYAAPPMAPPLATAPAPVAAAKAKSKAHASAARTRGRGARSGLVFALVLIASALLSACVVLMIAWRLLR